MKTTSSSLFDLIKKMTPDEKKYFARFIFNDYKDGKNNMLYKMFKVISSMNTYKETDVLKLFNSKKLSTGTFKTYKWRLKEKILQSLCAQGTCVSAPTRYRKKIEYAGVLAAKGLDKQAIESMSTIKDTLIPEFHITAVLARIEVVTSELWMMLNAPHTNPVDIAKLASVGTTMAAELQLALTSYTISQNFIALAHNSLLMQTKEEKKMFDILSIEFERQASLHGENEPLFITEGRAAKAMIETNFTLAHTYASLLWKKYSMMYHYLELPKENDYIFYGRILHRVITTAILTNEKDNIFPVVGYAFLAYEKNPGRNEQYYYYPVFLYGYLVNCYKNNERAAIETTLADITKLPLWKMDNPELALYRTIATWMGIVNHSLGNYETALKWIRKVIVSSYKDSTYIHYVEFCRLFEFIVEFESDIRVGKGISLSFTHSVESACDYLRKHPEKDRSYMGVFLLFFKHIYESGNDRKKQALIKKLKADINTLSTTSCAKHFNALFCFNAWVDNFIAQNVGHIGMNKSTTFSAKYIAA